MQTQTCSRSTTIIKWLAWFLLAFTISCLAGILVLESLGCRFLIDPSSHAPAQAYGLFMIPANALAFSLLGTLIITYRPGNRIGWLASLFGAGFMLAMFTESYGGCSLNGTISTSGVLLTIWLNNVVLRLVPLGFVLLPMLFPDGRFLSPGWKRLGQIVIISVVLTALLRAVWPGPMSYLRAAENPVENPLGLNVQLPPIFNSILFQGGDLIMLFFFLAGIASLVIRWRGATGEIRLQIKWLTYFLATAGVMFALVELIGVLFYPAIFDGWFYLIELAVFWLGLPLVIGLAIFKYRLYDIDVIIRRTLQYALLTIILGLVYFSVVILLQQLFRGLTGGTSPLVIVISTLVIAALFSPLRSRIQKTIDRRFYRRKYDAQQALSVFAATARDEVEMDKLTAQLLRVVEDSLQPEGASLWLLRLSNGEDALKANLS